jgi:P27 family predicted phage terminase small subunit
MWNELVSLLAPVGVLTLLDKNALALYCSAYADWREAQAAIEETGGVLLDDAGRAYRSPYVALRDTAAAKMQSLGGELGLTPKSREKMTMKPEPKSPMKPRDRNRVPKDAPAPKAPPADPSGVKFDENGKRIYGPGEDPMESTDADQKPA